MREAVDTVSRLQLVNLTGEQVELFHRVREIARDVIKPLGKHDGRVNREIVAMLGETGLLSTLFPSGPEEQFRPASAMDICIIREAMAYESVEAESAFAMQGIGGYPLVSSSVEHRRRWLEPIRSGKVVAGFALTEPDVGSDAGSIQLEATATDGGWVLNGTKKWITNAPDADFYLTFARTTANARARGVSAFLVPADAAGLSGKAITMVSPHPLGELTYDSVRVTEADLVGQVDGGFRAAMATFDRFRPSVGAATCGMAQAALDAALSRSKDRVAFGAPLASLQSVGHSLANCVTELSASRLLVRAAAAALDCGSPTVTTESAMAKMYATEAAQRIIDAAIQVHGAAALEHGHLLEGLYRDIRAARIYEGATEIQRNIIARAL